MAPFLHVDYMCVPSILEGILVLSYKNRHLFQEWLLVLLAELQPTLLSKGF